MAQFRIKFIGEPPEDIEAYFKSLNILSADACELQESLTPDELDLLERDIYYSRQNGEL